MNKIIDTYKSTLLSVVFVLSTFGVYGQVQPVSVNVVMPFPHSIYLSDYYAPISTDLQVICINNDFASGDRSVKLKFSISNGNIELSTKPSYQNTNLITLSPGVPLTLQGSDLADALNLANLNFSGITAQQLSASGGRLPEGNYQFCVEIIDAQVGKPLSAKICQNVVLQEHQPPLITGPLCGSRIEPSNPQIIQLNWQLATGNLPSQGGFNTYVVDIYEITDPDIQSPQNAVLNSKAVQVYTSEPTTVTNFTLDYSTVLLVPGKKYVFRIQGTGPNDKQIFTNNGYSEWCWFSYGFPEDGVIELQEPFDDRQFDKGEQMIFSWDGSDRSVEGQTFEYKILIAKLDDETQTAEQAILNNPVFYEERMAEVTSQDGGNFLLSSSIDLNESYAWKIEAYSGVQLVAESEAFKFHTPPTLEAFYASNQKIKVLRIENEDLNNFEGKARIQMSEDEEDFVDVPFSNLKIKEVAGLHVLQEGEINFDLSERDELELASEIESNGIGFLTYTGGKIDKDGLKIVGNLKWQLPHAVLPGEEEFVLSEESLFVLDNDKLLSGEAPIQPFETVLMDPKDFALKLDPTSMLQLSKNELTVSVKGSVTLPPGILNTNEENIIIKIADFQNQLDYIEINNMLGNINGGIAPIKSLKLEFIPLSNCVLDLSEDESPGKLSDNAEWKGFYVENYKLRLNQQGFDATNQIKVPSRIDSNQTILDNNNKFWISGTGLDLKTSFDFHQLEGLKFNSFQTNHFIGEFDIRKSEFKNVSIGGDMLIPFLDETETFEFTIPNTLDGLEEGYVDGLLDMQITYNPYGGENRMDFLINRAVFIDNEYLSLNMDVDIPEIGALIEGFEDFRLYGDYFVGSSGRNTARELDEPILARFKQLDVTLTKLGGAFLGGKYAMSYEMEAFLSDGFTGAEGGAPTFSISSVAPSSIEGDPTSITAPDIEVPDSLFGDDTEVKPTGFNLTIETPVLDANAYLLFTHNDPVWGTKFESGVNVSLKIPAPYNLGGNMALGIVDGMDYWYFDAYFEDVNGPGIEVIAQIAQVQVKLTAIVGVEGQVFRHMKSVPTEDGKKVELALSPTTQFGAKMYMQLIEPYTKGFVYQADLGLEAEILGEGTQVDAFTATLSGEASFLNLAVRTGGPKVDANTVLAVAESAGVADDIIDGIFPQSFDLGGKNITIDSKGLAEETSIEIGKYADGDGFIFGARIGENPGGKIGLAIPNTFTIGGGGYADGNGFLDLNVADVDINGKLEDKVKGQFKLDVDGLKTEFGGDYIKKKANFSFEYEDIKLGLNVDKSAKYGDILIDVDDLFLKAMANIPGKEGMVDFKYQTKEFNTFYNGIDLAAGIGLKYDDYEFNSQFSVADKNGKLFLSTPTFELETMGSEQEGKFRVESGQYLFDVAANFQTKTGNLAVKFPNHELRGNIAEEDAGIFLKKNDFEIGLNGRFDGTAGDLHLKEGAFIFDIGADLNKEEGYLELTQGDINFRSRLDVDDSTFVKYFDNDRFIEGVSFNSNYFRVQVKEGSDYHFLADFDKVKVSGSTIFKIPDFEVNSQFDLEAGMGALQTTILDHQINTFLSEDSMAVHYLNGGLDLFVGGAGKGSGRVNLIDADQNFGTGFGFNAIEKSGSIYFEKDDLYVNLAGNETDKTGLVNLKIDEQEFYGEVGDSIYVYTDVDDYTFTGVMTEEKIGTSFKYLDNTVSLTKYNDGEALTLTIPDHSFGIGRRTNYFFADYLNVEVGVGIELYSEKVNLKVTRDIYTALAEVKKDKTLSLTIDDLQSMVTVSGDYDKAKYGLKYNYGDWEARMSHQVKDKSVTVGASKGDLGIETTFSDTQRLLEFELGDLYVQGGVVNSEPVFYGKFADKAELVVGGVKEVREERPETDPEKYDEAMAEAVVENATLAEDAVNDGQNLLFTGDDFSIEVKNVGEGESPLFDIKIADVEFKIDMPNTNRCKYDIKRDNAAIQFLGNKFEQTIAGKHLKLELKDDDTKIVEFDQAGFKLYFEYNCKKLPVIFVTVNEDRYGLKITKEHTNIVYEDYEYEHKIAQGLVEVKAGPDYYFKVSNEGIDIDMDGYLLKAKQNDFYAGKDEYHMLVTDQKFRIQADDKLVDINNDQTFTIQVDPTKFINVAEESIELMADNKRLYVDENKVEVSDKDNDFDSFLNEVEVYVQKDQYKLSASETKVRFDRGNDFVLASKEELGVKYDQYELNVQPMAVKYKDNTRELRASEENLYIEYEGRILELADGYAHIRADPTKDFYVRNQGLEVQYDNYHVELNTPLTEPSFLYDDTENLVELSKNKAKILHNDKGVELADDFMKLIYEEDYLKFTEAEMEFKYDRYLARFADYNDLSLTNGVQTFKVKKDEITAELDDRRKMRVVASTTDPAIELLFDDDRIALSTNQAIMDYKGWHYALGKQEYLAVHEIGKPETGFVVTEEGIKYTFEPGKFVKVAPKNELINLTIDDKELAFTDKYSLVFTVQNKYVTTLYKDLSASFTEGTHLVELNKKDFLAGYKYIPEDVFVRFKKFEDNHFGLIGGLDKYSGFVKTADDKSIEIGGVIENVGQASVKVNKEKDIGISLAKDANNEAQLLVKEAKKLDLFKIELGGSNFFSFGEPVDVLGEGVSGMEAVKPDGPTHLNKISANAMGWAAGGIALKATVSANPSLLSTGRIQTGLTLPLLCGDVPFGFELRPGKVRFKLADKNNFAAVKLLCIGPLPPVLTESGYGDFIFEADQSAAKMSVGLGYKVEADIGGEADISVGKLSGSLYAKAYGTYGFGGEASLTIPLDGEDIAVEFGEIYANFTMSGAVGGSISLGPIKESFDASALLTGRMELEGDLDGAEAKGNIKGSITIMGVSKSFDAEGSIEI